MGQRLNINNMRELAMRKRGKCLSRKYVNSRTKLKWQCKEGHTWEAKPYHVKDNHWCPHCAGNAKYTIEDMRVLARKKQGKCLSKEYRGVFVKLEWECKEGHKWYTKPRKVILGRWCPECADSRSERVCRKFFEKIFNKRFPKKKPKWLANSKGNLMELDGYCEELRLAFEYHGRQHYEYVEIFHKTQSLKRRKQDDKLKRKLCVQHNIILIEIPCQVHDAGYEKMLDYIIKQCRTKEIKIPIITSNINYELFNCYSTDMMIDLKEIAKNKGGECISKNYLTSKNRLKFRCAEGHSWENTPSHIKHGQWCPICAIKRNADRRRDTIENMQKIARKKDGKCLSKKYINARTKLKWQCKKGHIWDAVPYSIKAGRWCEECSYIERGKKKRLSIEEMQSLAKKKGGKCLSKKYLTSQTKLRWQCKKGHTWQAAPNNIKKGNWCPECAKEQRVITRKKLRKNKIITSQTP